VSRFQAVLRETIEQDDGVVLRLIAYQTFSASRPETGGRTAGGRGRIGKRSRMIAQRIVAFFAAARTRSGTCL